MTTDDLKVRVTLDTTQAKRDLADLVKSGHDTAERAGTSLRGSLARGMGALGVGSAVGAVAGYGIGMVRSEVNSGVNSWVNELTSGLRADFDLAIGLPEVRAMASARQETKEAFAEIVGRRGQVTPDVKHYYQQVKMLHQKRELGESLVDSATGGGRGEDRNLLDEAFSKLVGAVKEGFESLKEMVKKGGR